jgi:hypothetical protein
VNAGCPGVVMDWPEATWMASLNSTSLHPRVPMPHPLTRTPMRCRVAWHPLLLVDAMPTADDVDLVRPDQHVAWRSETGPSFARRRPCIPASINADDVRDAISRWLP